MTRSNNGVPSDRRLTQIRLVRCGLFCATVLQLAFFSCLVTSNSAAAPPPPPPPPKCPAIPDEEKIDCLPGFNITVTEDYCKNRGCCWQEMTNQNTSGPYDPDYPNDRFPIHVGAPSCYYPADYPSYSAVNFTETSYGAVAFLKRVGHSFYANDVEILRMDVYMETSTRLRVKITDAENARYEVPVPLLPTIETKATDTDYSFNVTENGARFSIVRKSTNEPIFDASIGPFIFADRYIQLSAALPSTNLYGLGQSNDHFRRSFDWQLIPLFASLLFPDYGSHPFYLAMDDKHQAHGVFLFNSNAMDVLLQPAPAITYRVIGGILDFYFFLGPTPENVIEQYTNLIGKPALPPYWSLGFHLCKYNYMNDSETRKVWQRNVDAGINFDVQWNDIDYMDHYKIFTYDPVKYVGLPKLISDIHDKHMRYVPIIDSGVSTVQPYSTFDEGFKMDIFIKNSSGTGLATGKVWPDEAVFPDFSNPLTTLFWTNQYKHLFNDIKYDGAWIDMDEPTTFTSGSVENKGCPDDEDLEYIPAIEGGELYAHCICMSSKQYGGLTYDLHNLYGFTEAIATNVAIKEILNKRPFVMSRSTFPGHGHYGTHWTGDVNSRWHDLRQSIPAILNFNIFGIPMVGSDICGFRGDTTLELCQRWTAVGAFYPFARNHNEDISIDQDPAILGPDMVKTMKNTFGLRYTLLPFLYTQLFRAHLFGGTVVRPLFFEFPEDEATYGIEDEFMWGKDLLVMPVLNQGAKQATPYLPQGLWYLYPTMTIINSTGKVYDIQVNRFEVAIAFRGGSAIVEQVPSQTTYESRRNEFSLLVTLDENQEATGELFWDAGDSIDPIENNEFTHITFQVTDNALTSDVRDFNYPGDVPMVLDSIVVLGLPEEPTKVHVNNEEVTFAYIQEILAVPNTKLTMGKPFTVTWTFGSTTTTTTTTTTTKKPTTTTPSSGDSLSSSSMIIFFIISIILSTLRFT